MFTSRRAFTLVEMLLVVAVISLLIAILLPSLGNARVMAREVACRVNMAQIGRATISYAGDNGSEFPANRFRPKPELNEHVTWRWLTIKGKYIADGDLWICPGPSYTPAKSELNITIHGSKCVGDVKAANYAYNGTAFWRFSPNGAPDGAHPYPGYGIPNEKSELTLKNVRDPKRTFIMLETRDIYPDIGDWAKNWVTGKDAYGNDAGILGFWHRRGANWVMTDGSAKWAKLLDTANPDCWWHNFPEPQYPHVDWDSQVPMAYK